MSRNTISRHFACVALVLLSVVCLAATDLCAQKKTKKQGRKAKSDEWVQGVSYTTDWKQAIKTAQQTGKMLFIYNGWKRSGI